MFLILDALASGRGKRLSSLDVIGAGPRLIAGILEEFGFEYELMRVEDFLKRGKPFQGVSLVSAMSMDEAAVARAARLLRGIKVIGGPITSDRNAVGRLGFDLGVWGEGELALSLLLEKGAFEGLSDLRGIPNLVFPSGATSELRYLSKEEFSSFKPSVNAIKFYRTIPNYKCSRVYVEVVRGCSNFNRPKLIAREEVCGKCSSCHSGSNRLVCPQGIPPGCGYCSIPSLYGPPKSREEKSILEEIEGLVKLGARRIVLSGADFLEYGRDLSSTPLTNPIYPKPNLDAIESLLSEVRGLSEKYGFFFEVENAKPCLIDEEVASTLGRYLRGTPIHIGIETGDEMHSRMIGRPCGPRESLRAIKLLKKYGLRPYAYFIHSLPGQGRKTAIKTADLMRKVFHEGAEKITVYKFRPLPGTAFQDFRVRVDSRSRRIVDLAIDLNRRRKEEIVGEVIEAITAPKIGRLQFAYPVKGGPTIRLRGSEDLGVGEIVSVRIVRAISDRLVEGVVSSKNPREMGLQW